MIISPASGQIKGENSLIKGENSIIRLEVCRSDSVKSRRAGMGNPDLGRRLYHESTDCFGYLYYIRKEDRHV